MTVAAHGPRVQTYTTDGVSNSYAINFPFWELEVYVDGTAVALNADYAVTGGNGSTGSIAFTSTLSAGRSVKILGGTTAKQEIDLTSGGDFEPETIEDQLDRLTLKVQELEDRLAKSVRVAPYVADVDALGDPADYPGAIVGVNDSGEIAYMQAVETADVVLFELLQDLAFKDTVGSADIDNDSVTYDKIQNVSATARVLGRKTSGAGNVEELNATEVMTLIKGTVTGWTATQYFSIATLTDAATIAWDLDAAQVAVVTLTANRAMGTPTNLRAGATYILIVKQDSGGSRTLNWSDSTYKFPGGTEPTMSTAANAVDILTFVCDGTSLYGVCQKAFS